MSNQRFPASRIVTERGPKRTGHVEHESQEAGERNSTYGGDVAIVQTFARGLAVIRAFGPDSSELTLSDVARRAGIHRATARRLLHTLVQVGYVWAEGNRFSLRPRIMELGYAYLSTLTLPEHALPHLKTLAARVGESTYLSVVDGYDNVCIAHVPVRRLWAATMTVGTQLPAFATASGRVIMSFYEDEVLDALLASGDFPQITPYTISDSAHLKKELSLIRRQGWALADQELEEGLRTLAVPVRQAGQVVAAISVTTLARASDSRSDRSLGFLQHLLEAEAAIEADLEVSHQTATNIHQADG